MVMGMGRSYAPGSKGGRMMKRRRTAHRYDAYSRRRSNLRTGGYAGRELRFNDTSVDGVDISQTVTSAEADPTTLNCLNGIAQGSGVSQRGGIRSTLHSIRVNGQVSFIPSFPNQGIVKLYLVLDKQTNGTQMTGPMYLSSSIASTWLSPLQHPNLENSHRFTLLSSKTITFKTQNHYWNGSAGVAPTVNVPFTLQKTWKAGLKTRYLSTGDTVASIADNSIHVLAICTDNSGASAKISYISRIRFYAD